MIESVVAHRAECYDYDQTSSRADAYEDGC